MTAVIQIPLMAISLFFPDNKKEKEKRKTNSV
jgi:hypothetical protein